MSTVTRLCTAITLFIFMLAGCANMPKRPESLARGDYGYTKEYITWLVRKEMKQQDVTGLSIALVDDQRVVWAEGFGFADEANKVPATPETIYRAGSISKLFTATAAMQMVPTTWPTLDELLGENGITPSTINDHYISLVRPGLNVHTIHAEFEGMAMSGVFTDLLSRLQELGACFITLGAAAAKFGKDAPDAPLLMREISGRPGLVALQG